jgi:hypothetical protein
MTGRSHAKPAKAKVTSSPTPADVCPVCKGQGFRLLEPQQVTGDKPLYGWEDYILDCQGCGGEGDFLSYARRRLSGVSGERGE